MNRKPRVLVTMPETMTEFVTQSFREYLDSFAEAEYNTLGRQFTREEMEKKLSDKDYAITGWGTPMFDKELLKNAGGLKLIAHTGGSVGQVIDDSVYEFGTEVASANAIMAESVAEGTLCYILMGLRRTVYFANGTQKGDWNYNESDKALLRRKVGIISLGEISRNLIRMLKPFKTEIFVSSTHEDECLAQELGFTYLSKEEIFSTCDVISIHTAYNPATYHMINRELILRIKDGAVLVNTSRGAVIDEKALADELKTGRFYAVLDVFEEEPLPITSPLIGLSNVTIMPHRGGSTVDLYEYMATEMARTVKNHAEGKPAEHLISRGKAAGMTTLL